MLQKHISDCRDLHTCRHQRLNKLRTFFSKICYVSWIIWTIHIQIQSFFYHDVCIADEVCRGCSTPNTTDVVHSFTENSLNVPFVSKGRSIPHTLATNLRSGPIILLSIWCCCLVIVDGPNTSFGMYSPTFSITLLIISTVVV